MNPQRETLDAIRKSDPEKNGLFFTNVEAKEALIARCTSDEIGHGVERMASAKTEQPRK